MECVSNQQIRVALLVYSPVSHMCVHINMYIYILNVLVFHWTTHRERHTRYNNPERERTRNVFVFTFFSFFFVHFVLFKLKTVVWSVAQFCLSHRVDEMIENADLLRLHRQLATSMTTTTTTTTTATTTAAPTKHTYIRRVCR